LLSLALTTTLFPYTTLFRSALARQGRGQAQPVQRGLGVERQNLARQPPRIEPQQQGDIAFRQCAVAIGVEEQPPAFGAKRQPDRSEEHTSELQSRENLVCRL